MRQQKQKRKRKWLRVLGIACLILFLTLSGLIYYAWHTFSKNIDSMHNPLDRVSELREEDVSLSNSEPFSVLLVGVDKRDGDSGRSDTMIVLTVNSSTNKIEMLSIPRDTRTEIIGHGTVDKINHAYAFGGIEMSMDTVENLLDIPIDYYIEVNMESFKDIIDALNGVTVENNLDFTYDGVHFPIGTITLDGEDALKYSRMRYEDPNGDFGRQQRQRQIIEAVISKGASFSSLTRFDDIFDTLGENVSTNLSFKEIMSIQKNYKSAVNNIEDATLQGSGTKIGGVYYYIPNEEHLSEVKANLKEQLEIK